MFRRFVNAPCLLKNWSSNIPFCNKWELCCGYHTVSIPKLTQQQTFPDIPHREAVYGAVYYAVQAASNF